MGLEPAADHAGVHVTAQAQLQAQAPGVRDDLAPDALADVDDVADAVGPPRAQEHYQLGVGAAGLGLGEVQRDPEPVGDPGAPPRLLKGRLQGLDAAARRVPAQVHAHDALVLQGAGEADHLSGLGGGVAPVDGEDEPRVEGRRRRWGGGGLEGADDV